MNGPIHPTESEEFSNRPEHTWKLPDRSEGGRLAGVEHSPFKQARSTAPAIGQALHDGDTRRNRCLGQALTRVLGLMRMPPAGQKSLFRGFRASAFLTGVRAHVYVRAKLPDTRVSGPFSMK